MNLQLSGVVPFSDNSLGRKTLFGEQTVLNESTDTSHSPKTELTLKTKLMLNIKLVQKTKLLHSDRTEWACMSYLYALTNMHTCKAHTGPLVA